MSSDLLPGRSITPGETLTSPARAFQLVFQATDGNIVLYALDDTHYPAVVRYTRVVYDFGVADRSASILTMQADGNLVVYDGENHAIWESQTSQRTGQNAFFRVQDDGNLVIYLPNGSFIWQSHTYAGPR